MHLRLASFLPAGRACSLGSSLPAAGIQSRKNSRSSLTDRPPISPWCPAPAPRQHFTDISCQQHFSGAMDLQADPSCCQDQNEPTPLQASLGCDHCVAYPQQLWSSQSSDSAFPQDQPSVAPMHSTPCPVVCAMATPAAVVCATAASMEVEACTDALGSVPRQLRPASLQNHDIGQAGSLPSSSVAFDHLLQCCSAEEMQGLQLERRRSFSPLSRGPVSILPMADSGESGVPSITFHTLAQLQTGQHMFPVSSVCIIDCRY